MDRIIEMILILSLTLVSIYSMKLSHESVLVLKQIHDQIMIIK